MLSPFNIKKINQDKPALINLFYYSPVILSSLELSISTEFLRLSVIALNSSTSDESEETGKVF
jgi:hypothetical protein